MVSTAIIGIGFIAVFQMVQYSVRSIDVSGERTKANYIAGTIAEDIYAFKNQEASNKTFVDSLKDTEWKSDKCEAKSAHTFTDSTADGNIRKKWSSRVSKNYLKCVDDTDKKIYKLFSCVTVVVLNQKIYILIKCILVEWKLICKKLLRKNIYIFKLNNEKKI